MKKEEFVSPSWAVIKWKQNSLYMRSIYPKLSITFPQRLLKVAYLWLTIVTRKELNFWNAFWQFRYETAKSSRKLKIALDRSSARTHQEVTSSLTMFFNHVAAVRQRAFSIHLLQILCKLRQQLDRRVLRSRLETEIFLHDSVFKCSSTANFSFCPIEFFLVASLKFLNNVFMILCYVISNFAP